MSEAAVTSKGQITIPADIRKAMGLAEQDRVVFTVLMDGTTVMRAKTRSAADLKGVLPRPAHRVPTRELSHK
ncbi:MAG: type II toxin-antitoxin system PrlF family antitoxin [Steroidobacteraceae bacterium]|nr:type II toxin-antitoxin system PrlF family antitoxin [Steroidobacteraceae bacterium]MCC7199605.1 type II toxin-antitoxin system PrlF family antitoxin [Gammaproteobacteria bacterium]